MANVFLHIAIEISTEGDVDTGYTLEQWNALSQGRRTAIASQMWEEEAGDADGGNMRVITEGAEDI